MKKTLIILALAVSILTVEVLAVPMDKTHPSLLKPNGNPNTRPPMDKTHPSLLPPNNNQNTRPPMDKTHPSLLPPNNNQNTRPPMDKTHPSLVRPGYDWTHDSWYGNDSYYKKNWGYSKDSFRNWLKKHPHINKRDRKALEKLYKEQIKYERSLKKTLSKYNREIATLPAYRRYQDPTTVFISDFLNRREVLHGYRLSPGLRSELTRQERTNAHYFNLMDSLRN